MFLSARKLILAALLGLALSAAPAAAQLTTYGYGNARLGSAPGHVGIDAVSVQHLRMAWSSMVGGAINGQALSVDHVRVGGRLRNLLLVGSESGSVVAMDSGSGKILWRRRVGHQIIRNDCQATTHSEFGITGTMAADPRAGRVYAVDVTGRAWALALGSGRVEPGWPVRVHPQNGGFVWGALAISRGWLYVPVASLCDVGHVFGGVSAVKLSHPATIRRWLTTAGTQSYGGGIWGWGGAAVDDRSGDLFLATGNSQGVSAENQGYSEAMVELTPGFAVKQTNYPLLPPFAVGDRDFGTTPVLMNARGCPAQAVAINKNGFLFLYDRAGITPGPVQRIQVASAIAGAVPLYGLPAFDPASRTLVLTSPSAPGSGPLHAGVQAFRLTKGCRLSLLWQHVFDPPDAGSPPTIAGGVVYIGTGRNGWLRAFRLRDGRQQWAGAISWQAVLAPPTVAHGTVYVEDWSGRVTALRP